MTIPTNLIQLYVLLSYEKLQRSTTSQRRRPIEASLRNRLLVWRFLKQIENEPVTSLSYVEEFLPNNQNSNDHDLENNNPWILDLNADCNDDMDIESDLVTVLGANDINNNNFFCDTMNTDQSSDVTSLLQRAIGAERKQKSSTDNFQFTESNQSDHLSQMSETIPFEESDQFFQDLCSELTNTTAAIVSSTSTTTNALNFSTSSGHTLIH